MQQEHLKFFEILVREHEPMLTAYVLGIVPDAALAQDIVQESFLIAYQKIGLLEDVSGFAPWLRRIGRYTAFRLLKKRGREVAMAPETFEGMEAVFAAIDAREGESWQERVAAIEECFEALPDGLKTVCALHYFEDKKAAEISERLDVTLAAVLKRLERARDAIRDCVEKKLQCEKPAYDAR